MERLNIAEKNHQDWFGGHYFSDQQYDSEFEENMLCRVRLLYLSVRMEPEGLQPASGILRRRKYWSRLV